MIIIQNMIQEERTHSIETFQIHTLSILSCIYMELYMCFSIFSLVYLQWFICTLHYDHVEKMVAEGLSQKLMDYLVSWLLQALEGLI